MIASLLSDIPPLTWSQAFAAVGVTCAIAFAFAVMWTDRWPWDRD